MTGRTGIRKPGRQLALALAILLPVSACSSPSDVTPAAVATNYADLVEAAYQTSIDSAVEMQGAITAFLSEPSDDTLAAARTAWVTARDDYTPTEAFRFYDGPIDNPENGLEGQINAWPMDEAYVDYVEGAPDAGIINDPDGYPEITVDVLVEANEAGGETNISTGWHAIEFLLWGQDLDPTAPGSRPVEDYTSGANADRRATYLSLVTDLLISDLQSVHAQWTSDGEYRTEFLSDPEAAIEKILRGIGALSAGELAGERMAVAFETRDQEDEHSCFSDNTNADVVGDLRGIQMVYLADFPGVDGPALSDLVAETDPELDNTLREQLANSLELAEGFPATFEQMVTAADGDAARAALEEAIVAIEAQGESIARVATALGKTITLEV
jgi:putative iron-regulated protein